MESPFLSKNDRPLEAGRQSRLFSFQGECLRISRLSAEGHQMALGSLPSGAKLAPSYPHLNIAPNVITESKNDSIEL